jgi:hypothetical protein
MDCRVWLALLASGCSALNPAFDLDEESTTDGDTLDSTSATSSTTGVSEESSSSSSGTLDVPPSDVCVPELVQLIESCMHAAELSQPMATKFATSEWYLRPFKSDLLPPCTSGAIGPGMWNGDAFLQTLVGDGSMIDPPEAYFEYLCGNGDYAWCDGTLDAFRNDVIQACFNDFQVGFEFPTFVPDDPLLVAQLIEIRDGYLIDDCAGACEKQFLMYTFAPRVAPTTGGDAVRELLEMYVLLGGLELIRFDDGFYQDAPFAIALQAVQQLLGDQGWITVLFLSHGDADDCGDLQNRVLLAVHHEHHIVLKLTQTQCLLAN